MGQRRECESCFWRWCLLCPIYLRAVLLPLKEVQRLCGNLKFAIIYADFRSFQVALVVKEPTCQCRRHKRHRFPLWVRKIPWRRAWQPTPVFSSGESPWTGEPGGLQSTGLQRVGHNWAMGPHITGCCVKSGWGLEGTEGNQGDHWSCCYSIVMFEKNSNQ